MQSWRVVRFVRSIYVKSSIVGCGLCLVWLVSATPEWNFDVVCYAGVARTWLGESPQQAHANVYHDLAAAVSEEAARAITSLSEYREGVAANVDQFMVQLPMYAVKPLYVFPVALAVKAGANSIAAPFWISALSYGCFAVLLLSALSRVARLPLAVAIGVVLLLSPSFLEVGRNPTPDALSTCITFGGLYALIFCRRPLTGAGLLLLSIAARPDNLILCLAVAAWWAWKDRSQVRRAVLGGVLSIVVYAVLNRITNAYSWGVLFTHTYIRRLTDAASVRSDVALSDYFAAFWPALRGANVLYPSVLMLFVLVSLLGILASRRSVETREAIGLQIALWAALIVHFIAYPMLADRFFTAHYATVTVLTTSLIARIEVPLPRV